MCSHPGTTRPLSASVIAPFVSEYTQWIVAQHGLFQGYYYLDKVGGDPNARNRYRDHPAFRNDRALLPRL